MNSKKSDKGTLKNNLIELEYASGGVLIVDLGKRILNRKSAFERIESEIKRVNKDNQLIKGKIYRLPKAISKISSDPEALLEFERLFSSRKIAKDFSIELIDFYKSSLMKFAQIEDKNTPAASSFLNNIIITSNNFNQIVLERF